MPKDKILLIGDLGGSSSQWRLLKAGKIDQFLTSPFNATSHSNVRILLEEIASHINVLEVTTIKLYVAGLAEENRLFLTKNVQQIFSGDIVIENDLLGAARALCMQERGYVGILGTGSNFCFYDGNSIDIPIASLGYLVGDEGSGFAMGKTLIKAVLREELDKQLIADFYTEYHLTKATLMQSIYEHTNNARYLASFVPFLSQRMNHVEIECIVKQNLVAFLETYMTPHQDVKEVNFSGSVAFYFADTLRACAEEKGIIIRRVFESPIAGLALYHQQYG